MTHKGLAINPTTNDLFVDETNNLAIVTNAEAIGQHVRQRLKFFEDEWFLDRTAGVPWLQQILGQKYDPALADALVKAEILDTSGVISISSFSVSYAKTTRGLIISDISVYTVYEEDISV